MMKKSIFSVVACFCAVLFFSMTGCSKDNEFKESDLIGSWEWVKTDGTRTVSGLTGSYAQYNGTESVTFDPYEEGLGSTLIFRSDHTFTVISVTPEETNTSSGTWSLNGDKLRVAQRNEDGELSTGEVDVVELSGSKLVLFSTESFDDEYAEGQVAHCTYAYNMEYRKI